MTMKIYRRTRADMNIETFKPAIVYAIYIAATPEKVWQALTDAELSRRIAHGWRLQRRDGERRRADGGIGGAPAAAATGRRKKAA